MSILEGAKAIGAAVVSRRGLLVGLGGGSLAVSAAVLGAGHVARANPTSTQGMARPDAIETAQGEAVGYHVTEHIRRYYRTARL